MHGVNHFSDIHLPLHPGRGTSEFRAGIQSGWVAKPSQGSIETHVHIWGEYSVASFLGIGRKPENAEKTHTWTRREQTKLLTGSSTSSNWGPWSFELATHCTANDVTFKRFFPNPDDIYGNMTIF